MSFRRSARWTAVLLVALTAGAVCREYFPIWPGGGAWSESEVEAELGRIRQRSDALLSNEEAEHHVHLGAISRGFQAYERAMELDPAEPVFCENLASSMILFRRDAREHYQISDQQIYDRAFDLYEQALRLEPTDYRLAWEIAETYYAVRPARPEAARRAWNRVLAMSRGALQREAVELHLARVELNAGAEEQAKIHLKRVRDPLHSKMKTTLERRLTTAAADP